MRPTAEAGGLLIYSEALMKNIFSALLALTLLPGALMAQSIESLRSNAENMNVNVSALKRAAAADKTEIRFKAEPSTATVKNPFEGLAKAIAAIIKLIFAPNGDIEISSPVAAVPQVEGTLQDDSSEETYTEGASYKELQPADYQPDGQRAFQAFLHPDAQEMTGAVDSSARGAGVPEDLKRKAMEYFNANSSRISNKRYVSIVDFAAHSSKARFFILDLQTGSARAIHVAHGRGSDPDGDGYATKFSNVANSKASSLGFYLTGALYSGNHGKSMRLHGLSATNSNVLSRAVVVHESAYVKEAAMTQGRSFGCLAVAQSEIRSVLSSLNGGALIYAGLSGSEF